MHLVSVRALLRLALAWIVFLALSAGPAAAASKAVPGEPRPTPQTDGLAAALRAGELSPAEYALYRAKAIFDRAAVVRRFGWIAPPGPRDATPILRELVVRLPELDEEGRAEALRLLRRPFDARPDHPGTGSADPAFYDDAPPHPAIYPYVCEEVCLSWVTEGRDAPPSYAYVETVLRVLGDVWESIVDDQGFRPPKTDLSTVDAYFNPDGRLDVYLLDVLGKAGIYGYCSTDDPNVLGASAGYGGRDASAYCVLDNDYAEFGERWREALKATAAHEFFHAIQYAYTFDQDPWLAEATATWMEDEVFDDVDDNHQYVWTSQVVDPSAPLDLFSPTSERYFLYPYGAYTFFQLLTERRGRAVVRDVWEASDAAPGRPRNHSLIALEEALGDLRLEVGDVYHEYAIANYWPPAFYEEGGDWVAVDQVGQPFQLSAPYGDVRTLSKRKPQTGSLHVRLNHLTYVHVALRPGKGLRPSAKLVVDVTAPGYGSRASVLTVSRNGVLRARPLALRDGRGSVTVSGFARMEKAVLVLSNGSTRTERCGSDQWFPAFACLGFPTDDASPFRYRARIR